MTLTGEDTIILNEAVLTDLADGDVGTLDFPNDIMAMSTGKNKNTIFAKDESGCNAELVIRVPRGSSDDKRSKLSKCPYPNGSLHPYSWCESQRSPEMESNIPSSYRCYRF